MRMVAVSATEELSVASAFNKDELAVDVASSRRVVDPVNVTIVVNVTVQVARVEAPAAGVDC